jgi:lysophospholipase L1-like esterase
LLVLGSSVSTGEGASNKRTRGWAGLLGKAIQPYGFAYENHGVWGTHTNHWLSVVESATGVGARLKEFDVIFLSLSLANEGFACCAWTDAKRLEIEHRYTSRMLRLVKALRSHMKPNARLVIGGPYPHDKFVQAHLQILWRTYHKIKSWAEVDYTVNFLASPCHDGNGHWHRGSSRDPGHPNDKGHQEMFRCIDLSQVLGL